MKKAQGISMNVIIIAAIALIVLVILSVIFIGRMGAFGSASENCDKLGGTCYGGPCDAQGLQSHPTAECDEGQFCCIQRIG
jgi:hypothetical protein